MINRRVDLGLTRKKEKERARIDSKNQRVFFSRYFAVNNGATMCAPQAWCCPATKDRHKGQSETRFIHLPILPPSIVVKCGGWFFVWSFVVLFLPCVVWCCSCRVVVCVTCFSSCTIRARSTVPCSRAGVEARRALREWIQACATQQTDQMVPLL